MFLSLRRFLPIAISLSQSCLIIVMFVDLSIFFTKRDFLVLLSSTDTLILQGVTKIAQLIATRFFSKIEFESNRLFKFKKLAKWLIRFRIPCIKRRIIFQENMKKALMSFYSSDIPSTLNSSTLKRTSRITPVYFADPWIYFYPRTHSQVSTETHTRE